MKAVFLDMDGVILDSEIVRLDYLRRFLSLKGVELSNEELYWAAGVNDREIARKLVTQYGMELTAEACDAEMKQFYGQPYLESEAMRPFPGLVDFLNEIRQRGGKTGVVSSTNCYGVLSALNRFSLLSFFDLIVASEFVKKHKPSPEPYLRAADFAGVEPSDCLVIEDSALGVESGKSAGMYVVGFTAGTIAQDVSKADERAGSYQELTQSLDRWLFVTPKS